MQNSKSFYAPFSLIAIHIHYKLNRVTEHQILKQKINLN